MTPVKIALYHNLTSGGSKREAYEFARQFVEAEHTVHLFCPTTANEQFLPLADVAQSCTTFELDLIPPIQARLPGFRKYIDLIGLGVNLERLRNLAQKMATVIDSKGYDFVFVHHDQIVQSPYLLRYLKTPSVYYCAEPMRQFYEPPLLRPYQRPLTFLEQAQWHWYAPTRWISRAIIKAEDRYNVQKSSLLLTNSFFSTESLYRAYGLRARVVYLGVDVEKFQPIGISKGDFVLSVGAVSSLKGYDFIIQALGAILPASRPRFLIVGNSVSAGEQQWLTQLAQEKGVCLEILVDVSDDQLVRLYNQALAFVYAPILEPFGLAPVEAMACGTPVVAVKEGGVRESVVDGETGFLTERTSSAFAEALLGLLSDKTMQKRFGQTGREHIMQFWTWEHARLRFEKTVMQNILNEQR